MEYVTFQNNKHHQFLEKIETASESFNSIDELLNKKGKILQETELLSFKVKQF